MRSYVETVLVLCLMAYGVLKTSSDDPTTPEDYEGYLRAEEIFKDAFNFLPIEVKIENPNVNPLWIFEYANVSWVMGLRGRDAWGKWYRLAECNAVMVHPRLALVPCSCIWSWYLSYAGSGNFTPAANRTSHDITTPELFLFHTRHPPNSTTEPHEYFKTEETRYYPVLNQPLDSYECAEGIPDKVEKQLDGVALIETETPVYEGDNVPVAVPLFYDGNNYKNRSLTSWDWLSMACLIYGIQFTDYKTMFVPDYNLKEWNKKHERWLAWSNFNRLAEELVTIHIQPRFDKCRDQYLWKNPLYECWRPDPRQTQICNILPGSPLRSWLGKLYGMVMNRVFCNTTTKDVFLEVKRFSEKEEDVIRILMKVFNERVQIPLELLRQHEKSQLLFNQTLGHIFYDEDFDPLILYKIKNISIEPQPGVKKRRSAAPPVRLSSAVAVAVLLCLFQRSFNILFQFTVLSSSFN